MDFAVTKNTSDITTYNDSLEQLQEAIISNNNLDGVYGDGKNLVNNEDFPITNNFTDGLYMRQMKMKAESYVVSAVHNTNHFWFLLSGRVLVEDNNGVIEHIAPCWSHSNKGTKRLIKCIEDCVWINVIANPTDTRDMKEVEDNFFSITMDEHNKKQS